MSKLLRISGYVINPKWISHISIEPNMLKIRIAPQALDGIWFLSSGSLTSGCKYFEIKKENNQDDYDKIMRWIENNSE